MNELTMTLAQPWVERLGWVLLHFVWQGAAIAALYAAVRGTMNDARSRYLAACLALATLMAAPVATFAWLGGDGTAAASAVTAIEPAPPGIGAAADSIPLQGVMPWLVMGWFAGVGVFSVRLAGGCLSAARLRFVGARPAPAEWQAVLARLRERMGVRRPVGLLVSARVEMPVVMGWLRPVVLTPVGALTGLPPEHVEALLAHELAHVLRNDYLINLLQGITEVALFYHPAVWWVSKQIRAERELCCDDLAVAAGGGDVLTYARALAELEMCRPPRMGVAMAAGDRRLLQRIARLVEPPLKTKFPMAGTGAAWALSLLLLAGIGTLAIRGAQAQSARSAYPTVDSATIWVDTVKQGDMSLEVRGLGTLTSPAAAELKIAETQVKEVRAGQAAAIDLRAPGGVVTGVVTRIHPSASAGVVRVEVRIDGKVLPVVKAGTTLDGSIRVGGLTNVVHVGRPVFGRADSEDSLFRLEPDGKQAVRVKVLFGKASVNQIEVKAGLQPGDKIILSDMSAYKDAQRIMLK